MMDRLPHRSASGNATVSVLPLDPVRKPRQVDRVAIFTSPRAGNGARREQIPILLDLLAQSGISAALVHDPDELRRWCQSGDRGELIDARELIDHGQAISRDVLVRASEPAKDQTTRSVVVAAGGDGTITLAAAVLNKAEETKSNQREAMPLLVPMPLGTENLLARHFGHQADAVCVRNTILFGKVGAMDLGWVHGLTNRRGDDGPRRRDPMLTMVSCGFDADVVRGLHLRRTGHIHRLSYLRPIVRSMRRYQFPELTVQSFSSQGELEREVRCGWAMVFNLPTYGGGLMIEPDAVGDDGRLDVITFAGRGLISGLRYAAGIPMGRHLRHVDVQRFQATKVRITANERVHYQIDGDYVGRLPIEVAVHPQAIRLILPMDPPTR